MKKILALLLSATAITTVYSQSTVKGNIRIRNSTDTLGGISVSLKGSNTATMTDKNGNFQLAVNSLPAKLTITSVGYRPEDVMVYSNEAGVITIEPLYILGEPIVVSPGRFATKEKDAHVSIEKYTYKDIRVAPTTSYYDLALYKKGADITTSSFTFKTISTRGFNGSGSTRVNQFVDGMDNQAPGLNFFVGNFCGVTELDVESIEILPGASSALYGPGGINGTILISSKSPFIYEGLSLQFKEGVNNIDKSQRSSVSSFHDFSFRYAKAFKKFAFKIGGQYIKAIDWLAGDTSNYERLGDAGKLIPGTRMSDPNYDGVNVYGDETQLDLFPYVGEHIKVSRTGYHERDMIDPETKNIKLSGALHYKFNSNLEAQLVGYWSTGNSVYTGNNRYALKGIKIAQYKAELKSKNWFLRAYTTQEDAGEAYSATVTGQVLNELWKPSSQWYPEFIKEYATAMAMGADKATALQQARAVADKGRPVAGSDQFKQLLDKARSMPIPKGGLFLENSQLWMTEGQYRFANIKFANVIVGANWKKYILNSEGTLFIDQPGDPIMFSEYGAYAQVSKDLFKNKLNLSFSGRYDKNEDFEGRFTPRGTALIKVAKDHNIRLSYQTAYRFPSTQQKYIDLDVGAYSILGGLPWILDTMGTKANPVIDAVTGKPFEYKDLNPEACKSFEVGYKAVLAKKLMIDAYAYFGKYTDFLGRQTLYQPGTNEVYSVVVNSPVEVNTHGFGLGFDYFLNKRFSVFVNGYSDALSNVPDGFRAYFNTPKYRTNMGIAAQGLGKNQAFGFNVIGRWQDSFNWDGELANGPIESFTTIDVAVHYKINPIHTMIKLGGTNVLNNYYKNAYGNPEIGGMYYLSLNFDLLK